MGKGYEKQIRIYSLSKYLLSIHFFKCYGLVISMYNTDKIPAFKKLEKWKQTNKYRIKYTMFCYDKYYEER